MEELKLDTLPETIKQKETSKYNCAKCGKKYKSRSGLSKHIKKDNCSTKEEDIEYVIIDDDEDTQKKREELKKIYLNNPKLDLDKEIATNEMLLKIDTMDINELEARIVDAKQQFSRKMDQKISDGALSIVNLIVGGFLDITKELEEEVKKDDILREATNDVLCQNVLIHLPAEIKMTGLYSLDVGVALKKAGPRKEQEKRLKEMEIEPIKEVIEEPQNN